VSNYWRPAHSFLKPSLGIKSEHRFQDTVEEHVFPHFSADVRPVHSRPQFQGFGNTLTCPSQDAPEYHPMVSPKNRPEIASENGRTKTRINGGFQSFSGYGHVALRTFE